MSYVSPNGRSRGDPWSLRQFGVYQQIGISQQASTWILLQLPGEMRSKLEKTLQGKLYNTNDLGIDPMVPHLIFISSMATNWQPYIEHLHSQLTSLVSCIKVLT
jgi:hypothetical protein